MPNPSVMFFTDHAVYTTRPLGLLRVSLLEGLNLRGARGNLLCECLSKPHPYIILQMGKIIIKTPTLKSTKTPQ